MVYESLFCFGSSYCELGVAFFFPFSPLPLVKVLITNIDTGWTFPSQTQPALCLKPGHAIFLRDTNFHDIFNKNKNNRKPL